MKHGWHLVAPLAVFAGTLAAQGDESGCKDHPLFNRLAGYSINTCVTKDFDTWNFPVGAVDEEGKPKDVQAVEGAYTELLYGIPEGAKSASSLQILRNFQNAVKAAGGQTVKEFGQAGTPNGLNDPTQGGVDRAATFKLVRGGREVWVEVLPFAFNDGTNYLLRIVEREAMQQDIAANELLDRINKDGFIALYINFDTGKAAIKPDSLPQLDQVAQALKSAPSLKLEVAGHTDNVGKPEANKVLSQLRAQAVMKALTDRGIAAARLNAAGYGADKPLADNRSEEGRAKNRRVELVKR